MSTDRKWGRWILQDDTHLVYTADSAALIQPSYDIQVSRLLSGPEEELQQLRTKTWIQSEDLSAVRIAYEVLLREHQKRELIDDPLEPSCRHVSHADFRSSRNKEFDELLSTGNQLDEQRFQVFFEKNPDLLPHAHLGHHGACGGIVVSQPEIRHDDNDRRPDFMTLTRNSGELYVGLVEIEAPGKPWFNQDGTPTRKLSQAIDQIRDWKTMLADARCQQEFVERYRLGELLMSRNLRFWYFLVYGRRAELSPWLSKKRTAMQAPDETYMSYDRIRNGEGGARVFLTAKLDRSGHDRVLRIINMSPTFKMSKSAAKILCSCSGYREAIENCETMPIQRKRYLLDMLPVAEKFAEPGRFWHYLP